MCCLIVPCISRFLLVLLLCCCCFFHCSTRSIFRTSFFQVNYVSMRPIIRTHNGNAVNYMEKITHQIRTQFIYLYIYFNERRNKRPSNVWMWPHNCRLPTLKSVYYSYEMYNKRVILLDVVRYIFISFFAHSTLFCWATTANNIIN